jgi:hypothetical protein
MDLDVPTTLVMDLDVPTTLVMDLDVTTTFDLDLGRMYYYSRTPLKYEE